VEAILTDGLRDSDVDELLNVGLDPSDALAESIYPTTTFTVTADDHPVAMFGVGPSAEHPFVGIPWFLATDGIVAVANQFAAQTIHWVTWMNRVYPVLKNYVAHDNRVSRLWLRRAGFTLHPPVPLGRNGELYSPFSRHRKE